MAERELGFIEVGPARAANAVILSSPHNGVLYPDEVVRAAAIDVARLRHLEDGPTHLLGEPACADGAALLAARFARAFVDLNRSPLELDPDLLGEVAPGTRLQLSAKVQAGLGVVPSRLAARAIYLGPLGFDAVRTRLRRGYEPYHRRLGQLLRDRAGRFGCAVLVDLHSMPPEAARVDPNCAIDIALGDRYGVSCDRRLADLAHSVLAAEGFAVARNRPYAGGFITEHYGRPRRGWHALQIEIRRDLFMDPRSLRANAGLATMAAAIGSLVCALAEMASQLPSLPGDDPPGLDAALDFELPELLRAAD